MKAIVPGNGNIIGFGKNPDSINKFSFKKNNTRKKSIKTNYVYFCNLKKRVMSIDNINIMQKGILKSFTRFKPFCNPII